MNLDSRIKELIQQRQYSMTYEEKQARLLPLLENQVATSYERIPAYQAFVDKGRMQRSGFQSYLDIPVLPVSVFKQFDLSAVPEAQVVRVLKSSATTTGTPSKIYLDKPTAFRQSQALAATIMDLLGGRKRPYLVLDCKEVNGVGASLSARGAVLRGFMPFASSITYALEQSGPSLEPNLEVIQEFFREHRDRPVLVSGFTYIIWVNVIQRLLEKGIRYAHPDMRLFHSGGWKNLTSLSVGKSEFADGARQIFGCRPEDVRDFYGMVEQVGVVFIDCEAGNKHTPNFAEVAIRDSLTLKHVKPGESGIIEVLSALPTSYPGQALLTDDIGVFLGYDNCPCGRPGLAFRFHGRVARSEIRGCGDTFAVSQQLGSRPRSETKSIPAGSALEVIVGRPPIDAANPALAFSSLRDRLTSDFDVYATTPIEVFLALLDSAAQNLASAGYGDVEGIAFLSSWLRKSNLQKVLRLNLGSSVGAIDNAVSVEGISLRALPRGVVCHWIAGNIPTLAMFSWALATLAKNASILRIPEESRSVVCKLFRAVENASAEIHGRRYDGSLLLERTSVVHFRSTDQASNEAMSLMADARVAWGGAEAVRAVTAYPRLEHCEDLVFGPKYSIGVIDKATVDDEPALRQAFAAFARQAVMFEQGACSSPQAIFVEAPDADLEHLADLMDTEMEKICRRFPKRRIEQYTSSEILRARAVYGLGSGTTFRASSDVTYTVLVERGAALPEALQSRTIYIKTIGSLSEVIPQLTQKIQTIGTAIRNTDVSAKFTEAAALRGAARCVNPVLMNIYDTPWDGFLPVNRLLRWCRL